MFKCWGISCRRIIIVKSSELAIITAYYTSYTRGRHWITSCNTSIYFGKRKEEEKVKGYIEWTWKIGRGVKAREIESVMSCELMCNSLSCALQEGYKGEIVSKKSFSMNVGASLYFVIWGSNLERRKCLPFFDEKDVRFYDIMMVWWVR